MGPGCGPPSKLRAATTIRGMPSGRGRVTRTRKRLRPRPLTVSSVPRSRRVDIQRLDDEVGAPRRGGGAPRDDDRATSVARADVEGARDGQRRAAADADELGGA